MKITFTGLKTVSQSDVSILTLGIANLKISETLNIQWLFVCSHCVKTNHTKTDIQRYVYVMHIKEEGQVAYTDIASMKV